MVVFSSIALALSAVAGALATPFGLGPHTVEGLTGRGPSNFTLGRDHILNKRETVNFDQDFTTGGDVIFTPNGNTFTVDWDTADDFVTGVGWNPGTTL